MPFTTSHTALAIPLKKYCPGWFSLTGLMAGAMAPDLHYFLLAQTFYRGVSHSWMGMFLVSLPCAVAFSFAFHYLFKLSAIANLPHPLDKRLSGLATSSFTVKSPKEWTVFVASILIGILSHFFWDSFTHANGELAILFPVLRQSVTLFGTPLFIYEIMQHVSSIVGGGIIVIFFLTSPLIPRPRSLAISRTGREKWLFWISGSLVAGVFAIALVLLYNTIYHWGLEYGNHDRLAVRTLGLASWAGIFYFICAYTAVKRIACHFRPSVEHINSRIE